MSEILKEDKKFVWHPFTQMLTAPEPLEVIRAKDAVLYTSDGKSFIDCNSSWWVNVHGHGNTHIGSAINEQFNKIDHVIFAGVTHPKAVELAGKVVKILPDTLRKVFFSDNGSTSVEVALKMVFQFWSNKNQSRKRILAMDGAYHGDTFGAMSVGQRGYFNAPFEHFFFDVDFIDFPTEKTEIKILLQAEQLFQSGEFAGIILEPLIQGSSGMRMYSVSFLEELVNLARKYNVLVIFDEVMTAWGRTGKYFAMNHCAVVPDIVCLSKGLTGGVLPMGLTVTTDGVYSAFLSDQKSKALLHGHSFTANALACAAACASLELFAMNSTWENINRISQKNLDFEKRLTIKSGLREVRTMGTILALELETGEGNTYFSDIRDKAYNFFLQKGLLIRPLGNVLFINPPYCITNEQLDYIYTILESFLTFIAKETEAK